MWIEQPLYAGVKSTKLGAGMVPDCMNRRPIINEIASAENWDEQIVMRGRFRDLPPHRDIGNINKNEALWRTSELVVNHVPDVLILTLESPDLE